MKWIPIVLIAFAVTASAADIQVDLGTATIKEANQPSVILWLNTQPNLYTNTFQVTTNDVGGTNVVTTNVVAVVIPETTKQKGERTLRRLARESIRQKIRTYLARREKLIIDANDFIEDE
jgi:hypothetical protein